jgi:hypothetical protein
MLDSRPGFLNNMPVSLPSLTPETTSTYSTGNVRSQISYHLLDSRPGVVNNQPMSMPSPPLETTSPTNSPGFVRSQISYDLLTHDRGLRTTGRYRCPPQPQRRPPPIQQAMHPYKSYDVLDSRLGFLNNRPMSMPSLPLESTSPTHYSPGFVRSQISSHVLDSRPGFVNNRPMSMSSPPSYSLFTWLCSLTNIISHVRLAGGCCEQSADVDALPTSGGYLSYCTSMHLDLYVHKYPITC